MRRASTCAPPDGADDEVERLSDRVARDPMFPRRADNDRPMLFVKGCFDPCAVCLSEMTTVAVFTCGHGVCEECNKRLDDGGAIRMCVVCKKLSPSGHIGTAYPMRADLRERQVAFESEMSMLGELVPSRARGPLASPAHLARFGTATGPGCRATLVDIAPRDADDRQDAVVILLDKSGSMEGAWDAIVKAMHHVLSGLARRGSYVAVVVFSDAAETVVSPELVTADSIERMTSAIEIVRADGATELHVALAHADVVADEMRRLFGTAPRIALVTDGAATNPREATGQMSTMRAPTDVYGFGPGYSFNNCRDLFSEVRGRGDSSTLFEHASSVADLTRLLAEPRGICYFCVDCARGARVFFNGEATTVGETRSFSAPFVVARGLRFVVVESAASAESADLGSVLVDGSAVAVAPCDALGLEVGGFARVTLATGYVMSLSIRIPAHDVHTHMGLLSRVRAALLEIGPIMAGVIGVIDERVRAGQTADDSTKIARAASSVVRALTCKA
jgi:hypothetical protein